MLETHTTLKDGYYVGLRRTTRSFNFTLPKLSEGKAASDMDELWSMLTEGRKAKGEASSSDGKNSSTVEKSTSFSGWIETSNAKNLQDKSKAAPEIWKAAGGDDPEAAEAQVKAFKKGAAKVLGRCADTGEALTEATAREINVNSCVVQEMKLLLLRVSSQEIAGGRFDPNTGKWYREVTLRKFYLSRVPLDDLLEAFAQEIANEWTNVTAERKLVVVRSDRVTPDKRYKPMAFQIVSKTSGFTADDEKLLALVNRLKSRMTGS